jgi:hypothetical protein
MTLKKNGWPGHEKERFNISPRSVSGEIEAQVILERPCIQFKSTAIKLALAVDI